MILINDLLIQGFAICGLFNVTQRQELHTIYEVISFASKRGVRSRDIFYVTFTASPSPDGKTLLCNAVGVADSDQRQTTLATLVHELGSGKYSYCLVDLSAFSGDNDPMEEKSFGQSMIANISMFDGVRMAVVISQDFRVSSAVVLELQKLGVEVMDFSDLSEAKTWLYAGRDND